LHLLGCLYYLLTYSMEQGPSWEANWFADSQEIPAFYGTRRFLTALSSVRHLSLSWASPIQSSHPHPTSWRSILTSSSHLRLGLPSDQVVYIICINAARSNKYQIYRDLFHRALSGWRVKLITHFHLVPSPRTSVSLPPLFHTSTMRSQAQLCHLPNISVKLYFNLFHLGAHAVAQLVETLHYKPEGRGFDSRWHNCTYSLT
jgi:hypothetical protein